MIKKRLLLLMLMVVSMTISFAQSNQANGTVLDSQGNPVIGASIKVLRQAQDKSGSGTQGTVTDMNGKFTLKGIKSGQKLVISYVGMKSQTVSAKQGMKIVLEDDNSILDEVVVTAFGEQKRSSFTGSASVIGADKLEKKQVTNVMASLVGEVAGMEIAPTTSPGSVSSITIRGEGSINASSDPLIVLDGMPFEGGWNNINPNDVESVTVLKDAASNALYGSRGANGVIMITTKKGKAGKTVVTVDAKWGSNSRQVSDYETIKDPGVYYELYYKSLYGFALSQGKTQGEAYQYANQYLCGSSSTGGLGYCVYSVPAGEYLIGTNGKLNPNATLGNRVTNGGQTYTLYPDNWSDATYHNGFRQEYNASISAGSETLSLYSSFGYLDDNGIVDNSGFKRYSARMRATAKLKPWLNLGGNVAYSHTDNTNAYSSSSSTSVSNSVFSTAQNIAPIYPLYVRDANGTIMTDINGRVYDWGNGTYNASSQTRPFGANSNVLQSLSVDYDHSSSNAFNGDGFIDVSFLKDFKFTFKGGTSIWETRGNYGYNPYYGYSVSTGGSVSVGHYRTSTVNLQQLLTYVKQIGKHNINALIGHENYKYTYESLYASKSGVTNYGSNEELNGAITSSSSPDSYEDDYNKEGYFLRAMYDYDSKYFGQFSFRRDASSRFSKDNRWGNFWSAGAAWIISKEGFMADTKSWLNNLKLKISYGEQGNDQIGSYKYIDTYQLSSVDGEAALSFLAKGNNDISWETSQNLNIGIEFDMFHNRLSGSIEYYNRITGDMLMKYSTPSNLGYSYYYKNVGDLRNRGVEMTFSGKPVVMKNFTWSLNLNMTYNSNKVTYLPESSKSMTVDGYQGFQRNNDYFVGEGLPLGSFYIHKYAGVSEDGKSLYYKNVKDANGNITGVTTTTSYDDASYYIVENKRPFYGGFGTSINIYNFDISAQFTYSIGGKGFDQEYAQLMSCPYSGVTGNAIHVDMLNSWTVENTDTDIPRFQYGDEYTGIISDRFLIDNSYIAFQNFQVGYTLPTKCVARLGLSKLRFYVTGDNIALWSKRKGYDPRYSMGYGAYSPMRTISGGVTIQF